MSERAVARLLTEHGLALLQRKRSLVRFTENEPANVLLNDLEGFPHAFVIACIMDRQVKAELAWQIPFELRERLGSFRLKDLRKLELREVRAAFVKPTRLHRFNETMAKCFVEAVRHIDVVYGGDASRIWAGRPSSALVVYRFLQFNGVGPKIATMAVNILARHFKIPFSDYYSVDVSVDTHVRRVFERLNLTVKGATEQEIVYKARSLYPTFPGLLDFPAWEIGRKWCRPRTRHCSSCYMKTVCPNRA